MRAITLILAFVVSPVFAENQELGCLDPSGEFKSEGETMLYISQDLKVEVLDKNKKQIFIGEIIDFEEYKTSTYNNFANSPEVVSKNTDLANRAFMNIGENCQGVKMVWFIGEKRGKRKVAGKYLFERSTQYE